MIKRIGLKMKGLVRKTNVGVITNHVSLRKGDIIKLGGRRTFLMVSEKKK